MTTRVRLAPSPSGNLHVGTARTALFNYLFAKKTGGKFIVRIEDTDQSRSDEQYVQNIYEGLRLLGLHWDEGPDIGGPYGPYAQSQRFDRYREVAQQLIEAGHAYYCYLTPEELEVEKAQAQEEKRPYVYSGRCRDPKVREELSQDPNRKPAVRFRIPDDIQTVAFEDIVRGTVSVEANLIGDFVILKSDGSASYNFAVVVDDLDMAITHVIRGEDHVPNTPKQLLLYQALNAQPPIFAHVGMILAPDRSKMSKRHGATAVSEFIQKGYLPEAFTNFLTLLGWSPPDGQEVASLSHFAEQFTLERIVQSPAVFDIEKLNWLNGQYMRALPIATFREKATPYLSAYDLSRYTLAQQEMMLDAVREPMVVLSDVIESVSYFYQAPEYTGDIKESVLPDPQSQAVLAAVISDLIPALDWSSPETISPAVKAFAKAQEPLKMKTVMWAIRAACTGRVHGADLSITLFLLGRDEVTTRIRTAQQLFAAV